MFKIKLLFFLILFFSFFSCEKREKNEDVNKKPNILFLIADDWSYPHAGVYGDPIVRTPTFDRLANEGALFNNAFCTSPSCTASRASILTGRYPHQLESAGNLNSVLSKKFPNWVDILTKHGYFSGKTRKGWAPGNYSLGGYINNPAGKNFDNFKDFFQQKPKNQPFSFWFGSHDPHRDYISNSGLQTGMSLDEVDVPGFLPDLLCVRNDILDYYYEVERFDRECGQIIKFLEEVGELDNTIIVMTSDNGMPFPRAKANLYDYGTRMPLVIRWPKKIPKNLIISDFVSFVDFAPTFIEAVGLEAHPDIYGKSIISLFSSTQTSNNKNQVFIERERHANVRKGNLSYPMRALRNQSFLYIRNFSPERWPAGEPLVHQSGGQWGDVDNSISKFLIMDMENSANKNDQHYFELNFGKRPAEELYSIKEDPYQLQNLAGDSAYKDILDKMRNTLKEWMEETNDLRASNPKTVYWDTISYMSNKHRPNFDLTQKISDYNIEQLSKSKIKCID